MRKAQDITVQREIIHRGIVNLLKIPKRSENFYTIMEIKSLDENPIPYVASKYPVLLRLFFLGNKATVVTPQILPSLEMSKG